MGHLLSLGKRELQSDVGQMKKMSGLSPECEASIARPQACK